MGLYSGEFIFGVLRYVPYMVTAQTVTLASRKFIQNNPSFCFLIKSTYLFSLQECILRESRGQDFFDT